MGSQNVHRYAQNAENGFDFDFFLERYHKDGNKFLHHIGKVTEDGTWVSFVSAETKQHSPNKPKNFKQTSACQKSDGKYFLGLERSANGGIHATRDHNNVRSLL
jgi:hypothetical protein